MADVATNLTTARANYAQQLADLSDPAKRKLSYSIGGRSVSWTEYQAFLVEKIKELGAMASAEDATDTGYAITALE